MANYHVLEQDVKKDRVRVVFHVVVPSEQNAAGEALADCVQQFLEAASDTGSITSLVPWLGTTYPVELTSIEAGQVYEVQRWIEFPATYTNVQKQAEIDNVYNTLAVTIPNRLRDYFRFWGMDRDVT
jgi:hypothetical protein